MKKYSKNTAIPKMLARSNYKNKKNSSTKFDENNFTKHKTSAWGLFGKGLKLYLKNFYILSEGMIFPVFGQLIGIVLILWPCFYYSQNVLSWINTYPALNNIGMVFLLLILIAAPGFFIFTKAFWEYMIATVSLNALVSNILKRGNLNDIAIHNQIIKGKSKDYISLLSILCLIWVIGLVAPFGVFALDINIGAKTFFFSSAMIISVITLLSLSVYFSLAFQVFALENLSPIRTINKSMNLLEGNFWRALWLGVLLFVVTSAVVPSIIQYMVGNSIIIKPITHPVYVYFSSLIKSPDMLANSAIAPFISGKNIIFELSKVITLSFVGIIITSLMLPLGSACYTLLYFETSNALNTDEIKPTARKKK